MIIFIILFLLIARVIEKTNELSAFQKEEILKIWNYEYPSSLAHNTLEDFETYLDELKNSKHFVGIYYTFILD